MGKWSTWLCATVLAGFVADTAAGQAIDRPADERPQLEQFEIEDPPEPSLELPRPPPPPPGADRLMAGLTVFLQEVRVEGSTVFTSAELDRVTAPWTQRAIDAAELQDLVEKIQREVRKIAANLGNEFEIAQLRERNLTEEVERLQQSLDIQTGAEITLRALGTELEANQKIYDTILARLKETDVQDASLLQPDARIIPFAVVPGAPSSPRNKLLVRLPPV